MIKKPIIWTRQPQYPVPIDPKWLAIGLKAFYVLNANLWRINLVTGKVSGTVNGTGNTVSATKIRTGGSLNDYFVLPFDNYVAVNPLSIIVGNRHISGAVDWCALRFHANWFGIYGHDGVNTSNNNSFDGSITPVSSGASLDPYVTYKAVSFTNNNLRGCTNGGAIIEDLSAQAFTGGGVTYAILGGSYISASPAHGNFGVADFTHWGIFDRVLPDEVLQSLSINPWQVLKPQERTIFVEVSVDIGDVSKALTGQDLSVGHGSVAGSIVSAITGQPLSVNQGSVSTLINPTLTGQLITVSQGNVVKEEAGAVIKALTGQDLTVSQGDIVSGPRTAALTGQSITVSRGTLVGEVSRTLTGHSLSVSQGNFGVVTPVTKALTGQSMTVSQGTITAPIFILTPTTLVITKMTGIFPPGLIKVGGSGVGLALGPQIINGAATPLLHAQYTNLAADEYRKDIHTVPGQGKVLGVWMYNNVTYAFRNAADGLSTIMYRSSPTGWQPVALGFELVYTSGGVYNITVGETIVGNISGASAVLAGITIETGTLAAGTATGRFIFASYTGTFAGTGETVNIGANINVATVAPAPTAITFAVPGGRFSFGNYNFGSGLKMYGVDGKNRGFEWDGTTLVPITTGMVPDTPHLLIENKSHLFYAFGDSAQHSGIVSPYTWTIITGAGEMAMGDTITGFKMQAGGTSESAMTIFTRNHIKTLYGSSALTWNLVPHREEIGAHMYTIQQMGGTLMLDDRGITSVAAAQEYGNFSDATTSKRVQTWLTDRRRLVIESCIVRDKNQYRLFFSDGYALFSTFDNGKPVGMMPVNYPNIPTCAFSLENNSGDEIMMFGDDQGMVYQMDVGTSFDGENIDFHLQLAYNNLGSPMTIKTFKNGVLEVSGSGYSEFGFSFILGYASAEIEQPNMQRAASSLTEGRWDTGTWDVGVWDGVSLIPTYFSMQGEASNISIILAGSSDYYARLRFSGIILNWINRRPIR